MKVKGAIRIILMVVFFSLMCFSVFQIVKIYQEGKASDTLNNDLIHDAVVAVPHKPVDSNTEPTAAPVETCPISVDFSVLHEKNKDVIAWVYCPDTVINYPIAQSDDNNYYLRRLLNGKKNTAGTLFADFRNAPDMRDLYTVVYGHNMRNKTMFGILGNYESQEFYEAHPVWYILTPMQDYKVELIAGYLTPSDSEFYRIDNTLEARDALLTTALQRSKFQTDVALSDTDRLIAFSTCSKEYDNARFVLLGILQPIEKTSP